MGTQSQTKLIPHLLPDCKKMFIYFLSQEKFEKQYFFFKSDLKPNLETDYRKRENNSHCFREKSSSIEISKQSQENTSLKIMILKEMFLSSSIKKDTVYQGSSQPRQTQLILGEDRGSEQLATQIGLTYFGMIQSVSLSLCGLLCPPKEDDAFLGPSIF